MKMLLLMVLLVPSILHAEDLSSQLKSMAQEMKGAEEKLREDRHDGDVQAQLSGIEQKLDVIIASNDKQEQAEQKAARQKERQQEQKQQLQSGKKPGQQPARDSAPMPPVPPGSMDAAQVASLQSHWAKLPKAKRDELLQAYRDDLPERWKRRLEAYFISIAAEEAKAK